MTRRLLWLLILVIGLALLSVVVPRLSGTKLAGYAWSRPGGVTATPAFEPESSIIADCGLDQQVTAWIDTNANGQHDQDEPPLADVGFFVMSTFKGQSPWDDGQMGTSDATGQANLHRFIGGCAEISFDVSARPPLVTVQPRPTMYSSTATAAPRRSNLASWPRPSSTI